jgi:transcription antitermination factor NusG
MDLRGIENRWFALHVRSRCEDLCASALRNKGYEEFVPLENENAVTRFRSAARRPLFPGYVFCRLGAEAKGLVVTTPSVIRIVGFGNRPMPISESEIAAIRQITGSAHSAIAYPYLRTGQRVRLIEGPFRGIEGTVIRMNNLFRLVVSVHLLQRSVAVEVEAHWVVSVASDASTCSIASVSSRSVRVA